MRTMSMTIAALWRYPVKGLSPESIQTVDVTAGEGFLGDRRFALAHSNTAFDPAHPEWMPKSNFLTLARDPRLAALTTRWIDVANTLTVERKGRQVAHGDLTSATGRAVLGDFFGAYLKDEVHGTPRVVEAPGQMFTDSRTKVVSIISSASLDDLKRVAGKPIDPRRFRANIMLDGLPLWQELNLIGREITLGTVRLRITKPIVRCSATSVNPDTGTVDINIPSLLRRGFRHIDFGVYATVLNAGTLRIGDPVSTPALP